MLPLIAWEIRQRWHQVWFRAVAYITGALTLIIWLAVHLVLIGSNLGFRDYQHPLQDLIGWNSIAEEAGALAIRDDRPVAIGNWADASRIAWYARPAPVKVMDTRFDQFDLWFGQLKEGESAWLVADRENGGYDQRLTDRFSSCELFAERHFDSAGVRVNSFRIYDCRDYRETE